MTPLEAERAALQEALFEVQDLMNVVRLVLRRRDVDARRLLKPALDRVEVRIGTRHVRMPVDPARYAK